MHLVEKHIIKKNHFYHKDIDKLCFKFKNLYNKANYIVKQDFVNNNTYIDYIILQKKLQNTNDKDYRSLPVCCAQQTLKLLDKNWKSFFKSVKNYKNNKSKYKGKPKIFRYKYKKKGRFIVVFTINDIARKYLKESILKLTELNYEIKIRNIKDIRQDTI